MIKKLLIILLFAFSFFDSTFAQDKTDQRTLSTKIADLLAQLPANDAKQFKANAQDIANLGEDGYVSLITSLATPGTNNNALIEYAIGGFSAFVSQTGQEEWRKMSVNAYCKALTQLSNPQNKSFIISQLEIVGKDDAVNCLTNYLTDITLADASARALVKINSPSAIKSLISALKSTEGSAAQLSIIEALGHANSKQAAEAIGVIAEKSSQADLTKVSLFALANIADPVAKDVLALAAEKSKYKFDNTNSVASYLLYAQKLMETNQRDQSNEIAKKILEKATASNQVNIRTAALKLISDFSEAQSKKFLFEALNDTQFEYRASAIQFALANLNLATANEWVKKINKVDVNTQVAIINMLGQSNLQSILPALVKLTKNNNQLVKSAAISAAGKIGQETVLDDLLKVMNKDNAIDIASVSSAINLMKGENVTSKIAAFIPKAKPETQIALVKILANRAANVQLSSILALLKSDDNEVQKAAFIALKDVVNQDNLPQLITLLNETSDQNELVSIQEAMISAVKDTKNTDQQAEEILKQIELSPDNKKTYYYSVLASIGGNKSLSIVRDAFSNADEDQQKAALTALSSWKNSESESELIKIARQTTNPIYLNQALTGYLRSIKLSENLPEQKLLMLRNAMELAQTVDQKIQIIKAAEDAKIFNTIVFVGRYLGDANLVQAAANTIMNVTLAGKYKGTIVKDLLNKTIEVITGGDSGYQKEAMRKYLAEMPKEEGFVSIFNGFDLTGWRGLVGNPISRAKMSASLLASAQKKADDDMVASWKVVNGTLQFVGHGDNIASTKKYGDFELLVDWKIIDDKKQEGDAGIYLRGTPQVQIWDNARTNVGAQVGSGGLYNNQVNERNPLVVADNKLDEWNTFRILMKGDRVTVYLNGKLVTENVILENYWDKNLAIFAEEQIELQAHGSPVAYRDIYIREIERAKPFELSKQEQKEGYKILFDGTNMHNWKGNTTDYVIEDGNISIQPKPGKGSGGNLFTKEEFSDFVFRFEFQLTPGANNGLGIRAPLEGDAAYEGIELQILDSEAPIYKNLHIYQYHGSAYGIAPAKRGFLKPTGEWNYQEVIVNGAKIKVILNGTTILDTDITEARKNGAVDGQPHPGLLRNTGHIGFLGHGSPVQFKNIRIKDLSKTAKK